MAKIEVRDASLRDIIYVARHLREADQRECLAATLVKPKHMLVSTFWHSPICLVGLVDGEPVCVFGVATGTLLGDRAGQPWFVATDKIYQHQRAFLRRNRSMVQSWLEMFPRLENYVDARNEKAIQWLEWLGFKLDPPKPYGVLGRPFRRFTMEQDDVHDGARDSRIPDRDRHVGNGADAGSERAGRVGAV